MVALLAAARVSGERAGAPARLQLPDSAQVQGYLARMGFFRAAEGL
jgi:hypothetical protein